ncbi:MAG: AmmeMemoRadiSam system radical SAM enzyme [Planctomycetota bacterium]|nr:MAG: AmmeMemoRadiSam system radical SAM enzyme [Planctomycetota bacterium]
MAAEQRQLKRAVLWAPGPERQVRCFLCNWRCLIAGGKLGHCAVRKNIDGVLYSLVYDRVCAANDDPIEKKPLFHFQPGTRSFSVSTPGCNFRCGFCQNWRISQIAAGAIEGEPYSPRQLVTAAERSGCSSIAYTYTEPTIFMELCAETGRLARERGLANVFVSNGYMTTEAIDFARPWLDGINIDLKAFTEDYYKRLCAARLAPVLETIRYIAKNTNIWMELTTLIVPGENDSDEELKRIAGFISNEASVDVPWHVSRFYPNYEMDDKPPTPAATLQRALDIGKAAGLRYVYVGNLPGAEAESTFCYNCGELLINRVGYTIRSNIIKGSACPACNAQIAGVGLG